jgi:hypothetical protein
MPEIDIQRRPATGVPGWVWVLGALLLIGAIWWFAAGRADRDQMTQAPVADERVAGSRGEMPGVSDQGFMPVAAILANPDAHFGQTVSGLATVSDVVADRGFWIHDASAQEGGQRIFVALDAAVQSPPTLAAGQRITLQGSVANPKGMEQMPGVMALPEETRRMLQPQPAFIRATEVEVQPS